MKITNQLVTHRHTEHIQAAFMISDTKQLIRIRYWLLNEANVIQIDRCNDYFWCSTTHNTWVYAYQCVRKVTSKLSVCVLLTCKSIRGVSACASAIRIEREVCFEWRAVWFEYYLIQLFVEHALDIFEQK